MVSLLFKNDFSFYDNIRKIESQYKKLPYVNWKDEFNRCNVSSEPIQFWAMVGNFENAMGEKCFMKISEVMMNLFSMPFSDAFLECIFSFVTNLNIKQRNKLSIGTLNSVLRIKSYFIIKENMLQTFPSYKKMLRLFFTNMYLSTVEIGEKNQPGRRVGSITQFLINYKYNYNYKL